MNNGEYQLTASETIDKNKKIPKNQTEEEQIE